MTNKTKKTKKTRIVDMDTLTPNCRERCQRWWEGMTPGIRAAVEAWLAHHPVPYEHADDRVPYAYFTVPPSIDPWIFCKCSAEHVAAEWLADFRPNIREIMSSGDVQAQFRQSELVPASSDAEVEAAGN